MSSTQTRIGVLSGFLLAGVVIVLLHLWTVMVDDHAVWARRSHENRWAFRSVPSVRGALRDRRGCVLAHDEPTMELSLYYMRFRLRHPVGAAVHGATAWAQLQAGREGTVYSYRDGILGPEEAARDLLAMPARALRPGVFAKDVTAELATLATTVLSACSGLPRKRVFAGMRAAAQQDGARCVGETIPGMTMDQLLANYGVLLQGLKGFEADLQAERHDRLLRLGRPDPGGGILFAELERMREASLAGERVTHLNPDGSVECDAAGDPVLGDFKESISWPFADHVPFELAASLRVGARLHPGLEVNPSVQRICVEEGRSSLPALLGRVFDVDKMGGSATWVTEFLAHDMPEGWLAELVPAAAAVDDEDRESMESDAKQNFSRALLLRARAGISGMEAGFEDDLSGRMGMRLVERDAKAREQHLWSSLRVESGEDVTVTLDLGLQRCAEGAVQRARAEFAARHELAKDADRVEAALAVIDARSGDVLAFAGSPVNSLNARSVPGLTWRGNGSLGSVVKPFVLLEQLHAQALDLPHHEIASFVPCAKDYRTPEGRMVHCDSTHGQRGTDPVQALADSCNIFFYQCAEGLGIEGLQRAMRRFGLLAPTGPDDPFAACWQESIQGLPAHRPIWVDKPWIEHRAIGYGVHASPVDVARAYAGIATGQLPTLGLRFGEARKFVPLVDIEGELEVVRQGLRACALTGTAKRIECLARMGVYGKTGTAGVGEEKSENNTWFAGYMPWATAEGVQLCFCGVIYWVPDKVHGADAAGGMVGDWLTAVAADPELARLYLTPAGGR